MTAVDLRILAIDPGSDRSAWLTLEGDRPTRFGLIPNAELVDLLYASAAAHSVVVIEKIESYGMAVGREVFETVHWAGRFDEACRPTPVVQLPRRAVKLAICGNARAKDANIRIALIDRFGGPTAVGRKAAPGPLYGIANDVWSALAIAVTYADSESRQPRLRDEVSAAHDHDCKEVADKLAASPMAEPWNEGGRT